MKCGPAVIGCRANRCCRTDAVVARHPDGHSPRRTMTCHTNVQAPHRRTPGRRRQGVRRPGYRRRPVSTAPFSPLVRQRLHQGQRDHRTRLSHPRTHQPTRRRRHHLGATHRRRLRPDHPRRCFDLQLGTDVAIGYPSHNADTAELYLQETLEGPVTTEIAGQSRPDPIWA